MKRLDRRILPVRLGPLLLLLPVPIRRAPARWIPRRRKPRHEPHAPPRLAITRTQLTASNSVTNAAAYDTASVSPAASSFCVILVRTHYTTAGAPTVTFSNGTGLTLSAWSNVKQANWNSIASPTDTIAIGASLTGGSPGSGPVHIAISKTCSGLIWEVLQLDGCDLSGGTVASVTVQTGSGSSDTAGTTWTDTLTGAANTANAITACGGINSSAAPGPTWNNGFTGAVNSGSGEGTAYDLGTGFVLSGFTGSSHTVTATSGIWGIIGVEWKAAAAGAAATPQPIAIIQAVSRASCF